MLDVFLLEIHLISFAENGNKISSSLRLGEKMKIVRKVSNSRLPGLGESPKLALMEK